MDMKKLFELAGVDVSKGKAKKLVEQDLLEFFHYPEGETVGEPGDSRNLRGAKFAVDMFDRFKSTPTQGLPAFPKLLAVAQRQFPDVMEIDPRAITTLVKYILRSGKQGRETSQYPTLDDVRAYLRQRG